MLTPVIASADESPPPDASVHGTFNNGENITLPRNLFQVRQRYERLPDAQGREPEKWVTTLRTDLWTGFGDGWKLYGRVDEPLVSFVAAVIGALVRHARQPRRGLKYFAQRIKIIIVSERSERTRRQDSGFVGRRQSLQREPSSGFFSQRAHVNIVAQVLKSKPDQSVYNTTPMASVFDAITLMAEKNVGGLVVMEGEPVVGIITERDYVRKIALMGRLSRAIQDSPSQWLGAAKAPEHAQKNYLQRFVFRKEGGFGMAELDSGQIAQRPKFRELSRRKKRFLIGWWIFSTLFYFGLPIWAGNTTAQSDVGNMKIIGKIPLLYLYALAQYALCLVIAVYYARWANKNADRISNELAEELSNELAKKTQAPIRRTSR